MATVINGTDNTAATPALTGTDTDTGVFFPAANTMAFSTGGTEQVRVDSAGNLGIGTSSPPAGSRLAISGGALNFTETAARDILWGTSSYVYITGNQGTGVLAMGTGSTERMRIDSSGNLLVGTTSGTDKVRIYSNMNAEWGLGMRSTAGVTTQNYVQFVINAGGSPTQVGSITSNGTSTTYGTSSDYRLKENIAPMTGALAKVQALKPVTYKWKSDGSDGQGFIAHELQEIVPDCVTGEKDGVETVDEFDEDGKKIGTKEVPRYQGIDTSFLVATLTAAIQELKATVDEQAARIAALESAGA
jgi:hypothetical protein